MPGPPSRRKGWRGAWAGRKGELLGQVWGRGQVSGLNTYSDFYLPAENTGPTAPGCPSVPRPKTIGLSLSEGKPPRLPLEQNRTAPGHKEQEKGGQVRGLSAFLLLFCVSAQFALLSHFPLAHPLPNLPNGARLPSCSPRLHGLLSLSCKISLLSFGGGTLTGAESKGIFRPLSSTSQRSHCLPGIGLEVHHPDVCPGTVTRHLGRLGLSGFGESGA